MKKIKKFLKYCLMIFLNVVILFGLKMILPTSDKNINNSIQKDIVDINKI